MKQHIMTITYFEYLALYDVLLSVREKIENKRYVFNGTKSIPSELVAVSMLKNRYLFLYDAKKTYEHHPERKDFTFEIYQIAALNNMFDDFADCPLVLKAFHEKLKNIFKPYEYEIIQTEFQQFYEENLGDDYGWSYTELRDEQPFLYKRLLNNFLKIPTP